MATTIKTVMTYPLDGSTTDFNIPFEYLARKFVRVTLIGVDRKELILNQDYRFATKTTISTTRALGPADGYNLIEIRRYTSATERLVDFTDGSILRAYDLNISQVQTLHVAEEARDLTADTIGVNNDGDLDARGRRIVNVADAKDPGDVITLGQVQKWNESALNSANRAQAEANRATSRASEAATYAGNSSSSAILSRDWAIKESPVEGTFKSSRSYALDSMTYRDASKSSADASAASAGAAQTSEINAKNSEIAAKTSETNAKTSETNAKASEERAIEEANKLENMNDLAAAVESVDPAGQLVNWRYGQTAPAARFRDGISVGRGSATGNQSFINFYYNGNLCGTIDTRGDVMSFKNVANFEFNSAIWNNTASRIQKTGYEQQPGRLTNWGLVQHVNNFNVTQRFSEFQGNYLEYSIAFGGGGNSAALQWQSNGRLNLYNPGGCELKLNGDGAFTNNGDSWGSVWGGQTLSSHLKNTYLMDIYIGAARSVGIGGKAGDVWADGGGFLKGIRQDLGGSELFIGAVHMASIWKRLGNGNAFIIAG